MRGEFYPYVQEELKVIKIGRGNKTHLGYADGEIRDERFGRVIDKTVIVRRSLCGSGSSSYFHNYKNPTLKALSLEPTAENVSCDKCRLRLEMGEAPLTRSAATPFLPETE